MPDLPPSVVQTVRAMTRTARFATHARPDAIRERRDALLARFGYRARVRADDPVPTLVCYPDAWIEDGLLQPEQLESTDDAVEVPLSSVGSLEEFEAIEAHNQDVAQRVTDHYGALHGKTAAAFGTYMANHHNAPIEAATPSQVDHFRSDYFPRNAWPTDEQVAALDTSLELLFEVANVADPPVDG